MHPAELKLDRQWWTRLVPYPWRRGGPLLVAERPAEWSLTRGGTTQQVVPCSWREHQLVVPYSWRLTVSASMNPGAVHIATGERSRTLCVQVVNNDH